MSLIKPSFLPIKSRFRWACTTTTCQLWVGVGNVKLINPWDITSVVKEFAGYVKGNWRFFNFTCSPMAPDSHLYDCMAPIDFYWPEFHTPSNVRAMMDELVRRIVRRFGGTVAITECEVSYSLSYRGPPPVRKLALPHGVVMSADSKYHRLVYFDRNNDLSLWGVAYEHIQEACVSAEDFMYPPLPAKI